MNLQTRWNSGRLWLFALLAATVLAISSGGLGASYGLTDKLDSSPEVACLGPCSDMGGGGG